MNNSNLREETTETMKWDAWCKREQKAFVIVATILGTIIGVWQIVGLFVK